MTRKAKRGCVVAAVVLAAVVVLAPIQSLRWSGGFPATEFRLLFADPHGRPVPGVTLRVETKAGGASYLYPIDEFLPHQVPTSDADGRMTIHHTGGGGASFGGSVSRSLVGVQYGEFVVPQYVCVFSHGGREVHRTRFDDLQRGGRGGPSTVEVAWKDTDWPRREVLADEGNWHALNLRLFDGDRNGVLDLEERCAARYFSWVADMPKNERIRFSVVERLITLTGI